ncbi:MAG: L-seryl-tRNA(Sec) selenium transferase [Chloroflexota bacterium]
MTLQDRLRELPSVEKVLTDGRVSRLNRRFSRDVITGLIRDYLAEARRTISSGGDKAPSLDDVVRVVLERASGLGEIRLKRVINATGVILHTNLGRAPLSERAVEAMTMAGRGYNNLEFDLESGERGSRQIHVEPLLLRLTGAEAALVVNNNAAAVLLGLTALARRKEVVVSRGQEVQIGGGFRITEVMRESGAKLVEVGTTNCTYIEDYEEAITPKTAALLRVHTSNFKVTGFTHSVGLEELVELGKRHSLPVLDDLGSGCLFDTAKFGLDAEPRVQESLAKGAALVFFSGDKLLGGPQAGIILGRRELVDKLKKHPLARAVRMDKLHLAALAASLLSYLGGSEFEELPVLRLIALPLSEIERRAEKWAGAIGGSARVVPGMSAIGGGSLPGSELPTRLVAIKFRGEGELRAAVKKLREHQPPVIARVAKNTLLLDPRCVLPEEGRDLLDAVREVVKIKS